MTVIAQITDGLGNQLFQYAVARRLALRQRTNLKLDLSWYARNRHRRYELNQFRIAAEPAGWRDVAAICPGEALLRGLPAVLGRWGSRGPNWLLRKAGVRSTWIGGTLQYKPDEPLPPLARGGVAAERHFHFDPAVLDLPDHTVLCGYWQSERYFADAADTVRGELCVKTPLMGKNLECAQLIQSTRSVSLHVRRGDKTNWAEFPCTTVEFCRAAIEWVARRMPDARFFVFSDDHAWVRQNVGFVEDLVLVDHNGPHQAAEDLRLMSLCHHNIIAPSSLSWWGAWLNPTPDKIVISPHHRHWLQFPHADTRDVLPAGWQQLEAGAIAPVPAASTKYDFNDSRSHEPARPA